MPFYFGIDHAFRLCLGGVRNVTSAVTYTVEAVLPQGDDHAMVSNYISGGGPENTGAGASDLYEEATGMLSLSTLCYTYVRFRQSSEEKLDEYMKREGLSKSTTKAEFIEDDRDFDVLVNATKKRDQYSRELVDLTSAASTNGTKNDLAVAVQKYADAVKGVEGLMTEWDLTSDDVHKITNERSHLELPRQASDIARDFRDNAERISLFLSGFGGEELSVGALDDIVKNAGSDSLLYAVDHEFAPVAGFKSELVWAITINKKKKQICVVFRGTVPTVIQDYITDVRFKLRDCEIAGTVYGKVHRGFYGYLFDETKRGKDGRTISKSLAIMGKLVELFKQPQYQQYKLNVTGHSLGAALSTLFAFKAAMDPDIPKPVTCVSFASPYVGDQEFRDAFQKLESQSFIRHLRISNHEDLVPLGFPASRLLFFGKRYKHVGMNIKLFQKSFWHKDTVDYSYPKKDDPLDEWSRALNQNPVFGLPLTNGFRNHLPDEYRKRLDDAEKELRELKLDNMYSRRSVVGPSFLLK